MLKITCLGGAVALALIPGSALAAEFQVTRSDDPAFNTCDPGDCSLRGAVVAANTRRRR